MNIRTCKMGRAFYSALPIFFLLGIFTLLTGFTSDPSIFEQVDVQDVLDTVAPEDIWDINNPVTDIWDIPTDGVPEQPQHEDTVVDTSSDLESTLPISRSSDREPLKSWYTIQHEWENISAEEYNDYEVLYTLGSVPVDVDYGAFNLNWFVLDFRDSVENTLIRAKYYNLYAAVILSKENNWTATVEIDATGYDVTKSPSVWIPIAVRHRGDSEWHELPYEGLMDFSQRSIQTVSEWCRFDKSSNTEEDTSTWIEVEVPSYITSDFEFLSLTRKKLFSEVTNDLDRYLYGKGTEWYPRFVDGHTVAPLIEESEWYESQGASYVQIGTLRFDGYTSCSVTMEKDALGVLVPDFVSGSTSFVDIMAVRDEWEVLVQLCKFEGIYSEEESYGDTEQSATCPVNVELVGEPVALNASNNWTYTWEGLDKLYFEGFLDTRPGYKAVICGVRTVFDAEWEYQGEMACLMCISDLDFYSRHGLDLSDYRDTLYWIYTASTHDTLFDVVCINDSSYMGAPEVPDPPLYGIEGNEYLYHLSMSATSTEIIENWGLYAPQEYNCFVQMPLNIITGQVTHRSDNLVPGTEFLLIPRFLVYGVTDSYGYFPTGDGIKDTSVINWDSAIPYYGASELDGIAGRHVYDLSDEYHKWYNGDNGLIYDIPDISAGIYPEVILNQDNNYTAWVPFIYHRPMLATLDTFFDLRPTPAGIQRLSLGRDLPGSCPPSREGRAAFEIAWEEVAYRKNPEAEWIYYDETNLDLCNDKWYTYEIGKNTFGCYQVIHDSVQLEDNYTGVFPETGSIGVTPIYCMSIMAFFFAGVLWFGFLCGRKDVLAKSQVVRYLPLRRSENNNFDNKEDI